jgi:peptidoglycan/LPS O-acetylase OafA/YrhL
MPANNTIVPGGWSIGTEMAFYLVFPLLWYMQKRMKWEFFISSTFLICIFFTFILINYLKISINNNEFYFFNIINQLNVFCIGIVYYIINIKNKKYNYNKKMSFLIFLLFTFICVITWKIHHQYSFYFVPIFCAISYWGLIDIIRNNKIYLMKIFSAIGKVSFSIYIFHFIIIHIFNFLLLKNLKLDSIYENIIVFIITYMLIIYISYIIGRVSNKFIEKPFINLGKKLISKLN